MSSWHRFNCIFSNIYEKIRIEEESLTLEVLANPLYTRSHLVVDKLVVRLHFNVYSKNLTYKFLLSGGSTLWACFFFLGLLTDLIILLFG